MFTAKAKLIVADQDDHLNMIILSIVNKLKIHKRVTSQGHCIARKPQLVLATRNCLTVSKTFKGRAESEGEIRVIVAEISKNLYEAFTHDKLPLNKKNVDCHPEQGFCF